MMLNKYTKLLKQQKRNYIIVTSIILLILITGIFVIKIEKLEAVHYVVGESSDIQEITIPEGYQLYELLVEDGANVKQDQDLLILKNKDMESNTEKLTLIKQYLDGSILEEDINKISLEIEEIESQKVQIENENTIVDNQISDNKKKIVNLQEYKNAIYGDENISNEHPYSADYKNYKLSIENKTDKEIEVVTNKLEININTQIQELEDANKDLLMTKKDGSQIVLDLYITRYAGAGDNNQQVYKVIRSKIAGKVQLMDTSNDATKYMQVLPERSKVSIYVSPNQVHVLADRGYLKTIDNAQCEFKINHQSKTYDIVNNLYIYEIETEDINLNVGSNGEAYITKDKVNIFNLIKSYIFGKKEKENEIRN